MAVILCEKHGRQYCVFCSPYLENQIREAAPPQARLFALKLDLLGEPGFFWVDEGFLQQQNIGYQPDEMHVYITDEDRAFDLYARLKPVCVRCYEDYLAHHGLERPERFY